MTRTAKIAVVTILTIAALAATTWAELPIGLYPETEIVDSGSVTLYMDLPGDVAMSQVRLHLDDEVIAEDLKLTDRYILETRDLEDGEHYLLLYALAEDGGQGFAETMIFVHNPTVQVVSYEAPDSVGRGCELEITVRTEGEVERIEPDFSSFDSRFTPDQARVDRVDYDLFRITYTMNGEADGDEGWHDIPMDVVGSDGSRYHFDGPGVFLASANLLPIRSSHGVLKRETVSSDNDWSATARVTNMSRSLDLIPGQEVNLTVEMEGDKLMSSQLLISMDNYGGYLAVPVAGLEAARTGQPTQRVEDDGWKYRQYDVPITLLANSAFALTFDSGVIRVAMMDSEGRVIQAYGCLASTQAPPPPPPTMYTLEGVGKYTMLAPNKVWTLRSLAGLPLEIRDAHGTLITRSTFSAQGHYKVQFVEPTDPAAQPYSFEVVAEEAQLQVTPIGSSTPYRHVVMRWNAMGMPNITHSFTIQPVDSAPFHIFSTMRAGMHWTASNGNPLTNVLVRWTAGQDSPACPGSSCFQNHRTQPEIFIKSGYWDADEWDTTVLLHELGHWIVARTSRDDSQGGWHCPNWRYDPRLAWSEGAATYIGQEVFGNPWYTNLKRIGRSAKRLDDLSWVHKGLDGLKHSEWVVGAFLLDLVDPPNRNESDRMQGWDQRIVTVLDTLGTTNQLDRGFIGEVDTADFVRHLVCSGSQTDRRDVGDLLWARFDIDWLRDPSFCN